MRIMVDTNILISIAVFNSQPLNGLLTHICLHHHLVLSSYIVEEFERVIKEEFPAKLSSVSTFLSKLPFELEYTPSQLPDHELFEIRDKKDEPILYSAITADIDILISGDNDLLVISIERPAIMTASDFMANELSNC